MWTQAERRALRYIATGEYDKAISEYQKLLSEVGDDPDIYNAIGDLYIKKNDIEKAVDAYEKAIELYRKDGLVENAIAVARKALRYNESNKYLYLTLSELYAQIGRHDEALGYLSAFLDRGIEKEDVKRLQVAFKELAAAISKDMERKNRFERLFNRFQEIVEELGDISLEEAKRELEESGGVVGGLHDLPKEEEYEPSKYEQPTHEAPPPETLESELSEEEIEKLAEWPTEEMEQKVWEEQPALHEETTVPTEPWEYGTGTAPEAQASEVIEQPFETKVSIPLTPQEPQPSEEVEEIPESVPSVEPTPPPPSTELEDVSAILNEILEEEPSAPAIEKETPLGEKPIPVQEPVLEEYQEKRGSIGLGGESVAELPVEELSVPSQEVPLEEKTPEKEISQEEVSPVELFLKSTPPPEEKKPPIVEEVTAAAVPSVVGDIRADIISILKSISAFLASSTKLYYPDLDPLEFGRILMNMKLYDEAFRQFQRYIRYLRPGDSTSNLFDTIKLSGLSLFHGKKYRLAIKQFEKALKLNGRDPEIYYLIGLSYERLGNTRKALDYYEEAYLIDVDFRDVSKRIKALSSLERR